MLYYDYMTGVDIMYRQEHPKPQFMRENWQNLNGEWDFCPDPSVSGNERELFKYFEDYTQKINVPFCVESKLSGIGYTDFINSVWYKREIEITEKQLEDLVFLHFGAVDYEADIYINEKFCGNHKGGYTSFKFDITTFLKVGSNTVVVNAKDDTRNRLIPSGKQSGKYSSYQCMYTRTTGIWQTVWLEFVPKTHIKNVKYTTNTENSTLIIDADLSGSALFTAEAFYNGKAVGKSEVNSNGGKAVITVSLAEKHLWEVGNGRLYDLVLTYGKDKVNSYFGLRSIRLDGYKFLINEKSVFQRLVLDQGFYPDGIYTAPSDDDLKGDIERSLAMGFNGARLHEKIFEERFLYHADKLGYIVWGEYPNWGLDHTYADSIYGILSEWIEEVNRDFNHPSIIGWCPYNETWDIAGRKQFDNSVALVYKVTKAIDTTRPVIDTSGNHHVITDIYDLHDYEQNPETFATHYATLGKENKFAFPSACEPRQHYNGKTPFFVSEYGGIGWALDKNCWGYGNSPKTPEEFLKRLKVLTDALLDNKLMFGFCYTQLTDVEQEQNGLFTYDRVAKFPPKEIHKIFSKKAAIED